MTNASPSSKIRLFADDTNIFLFHSDLATLYNNVNDVLGHVSDWMLANKLTINIDKTNYTVFSPRRVSYDDTNLKLFINGSIISKAKHVKYLGIFIDDELKWSDHIRYIYIAKLKDFLECFIKCAINYQFCV